jgi:methionyl-tRNA synthetase
MGKDNITFHSQIWPAELLAYSGKGDHGGKPGQYGELNLPTEVVSSEFLTMEGKKFSSSQRVVIYVRDLLSRYQPDAFRYFVAAAGPENQDSDFTWSEFVRRTNDELVAGWGNLVNRTANLIAKNFGEIPPAGDLDETDQAMLDHVEATFGTVGDLIGRHRQKAAIGEAMRAVAEVNKYVSDTEPWKLKGDGQRERLGTVLHVVAQCVWDLNRILSPFLPFSANAVHAVFGGTGEVQPMPRLEEAADLDGGAGYPIITGDYSGVARWERAAIVVGTPVAKPVPVFTKLDPAVVDEELARLTG